MECICNNLKRIMLILFVAIIIMSLIFAFSYGEDYILALMCGALLCVVLIIGMPYLSKIILRIGAVNCFLLLSIICLLVKCIWIYYVRVEPAVDYATFYYYAESLSENEVAASRYVALFPHIFGYSYFLSIFIKVFGAGYNLAPILNVIMSVLSGMMLFRISYRLINLQAAVSIYLLWSFCPSQTMYNSLALSEPLYTMMIIAFILILTEINAYKGEVTIKTVGKMSFIGLMAGILLRSINCCRPIAAIFLIAVAIWLVVLRTKELINEKFSKVWISFLIPLLCVYIVTGFLWNEYISMRLGEEPATIPGYNILVGFNSDSLGKWNQEDSDLLFYYSDQPNATARWAQEQMFKEARKRIFSGQINFSYLMKEKVKTFLGSDDACVGYNSQVLTHIRELGLLSNSYYYAIMILSLLSIMLLWKKSGRTVAMMFPLYIIGLTLAQMLVEVAPRYHYSIIPVILLLGQYTLIRDHKKVDY